MADEADFAGDRHDVELERAIAAQRARLSVDRASAEACMECGAEIAQARPGSPASRSWLPVLRRVHGHRRGSGETVPMKLVLYALFAIDLLCAVVLAAARLLGSESGADAIDMNAMRILIEVAAIAIIEEVRRG